MLVVKNLRVHYGKIKVLKGVSLNVRPGEIVTVIGGNVAGKTTLLRAVSRFAKGGVLSLDESAPFRSPHRPSCSPRSNGVKFDAAGARASSPSIPRSSARSTRISRPISP